MKKKMNKIGKKSLQPKNILKKQKEITRNFAFLQQKEIRKA